MSVQIALLRAVNVGGNAMIAMADLRAMAEKAGLKNVRSLLQSGNLVFDAGSKSPAAIESALEAGCARTFGVRTVIYVREQKDIEGLIADNPFPREAVRDPGRLIVLFMRTVPPAAAFETLQAAIKGPETVRGAGRHAYIVYPDGMGRSKLTAKVIERHLGALGTARNWNTVLKFAAAAAR